FAPEQRLERRGVAHVFVDFHVGRRVVAAAQPAPAHPALALDALEELAHRVAQGRQLLRRDLVVDVVDVHSGIGTTARSSLPPSAGAASTTVPPWKSLPGRTSPRARAWTMWRLSCPRYWVRATISWPG